MGMNPDMQKSFTDYEYSLRKKVTRRERFLDMMDSIIPWEAWVALMEPHYPSGRCGRPPIGIGRMLRMHLPRIFFSLSDPATEDEIYDSYAMRRFARINFLTERVPDGTTLCRFRHLLEEHDLNQAFFDLLNQMLDERGLIWRGGTVIDATIIESTGSTKNSTGMRDPEMRQTRKGNQWHHGMKAHTGVDAGTGLVHSVTFTAANAADITEAHDLIRGDDDVVYADAGYTGVAKRPEIVEDRHLGRVEHRVSEKIGKRGKMRKDSPGRSWMAAMESRKSAVRSKVEHVFRIIKIQFGYNKTAYRGLKKNGCRILGALACANLYMLATAGRSPD